MNGNSKDDTNFPYKVLLTDTQVVSLRKVFGNNSCDDIRLSKKKKKKNTIWWISCKSFMHIGPLVKPVLPLMKDTLTPLAKSIVKPLGLTAAAAVMQ